MIQTPDALVKKIATDFHEWAIGGSLDPTDAQNIRRLEQEIVLALTEIERATWEAAARMVRGAKWGVPEGSSGLRDYAQIEETQRALAEMLDVRARASALKEK